MHHVQTQAVLSFVSDNLQPNEIFVVDDPKTKTAYIYYNKTQDLGYHMNVYPVRAIQSYKTIVHDRYLEYVTENHLSNRRPVSFSELQSHLKN